MTSDPWKPVTDEAQLKVGMTVELRPCRVLNKRLRFMLFRRKRGYCCICDRDDELWITSSAAGKFCYRRAIPERRLYALIDDDTAADETTVTRRRELVK